QLVVELARLLLPLHVGASCRDLLVDLAMSRQTIGQRIDVNERLDAQLRGAREPAQGRREVGALPEQVENVVLVAIDRTESEWQNRRPSDGRRQHVVVRPGFL